MVGGIKARWLSRRTRQFVPAFAIASTLSCSLLLNTIITSRAQALDLLQPVTSILDNLLRPATPTASQPSSSNPPPSAPQSSQTTSQNTPQPSFVSPSIDISTPPQEEVAYEPIAPELTPVVLGETIEKAEFRQSPVTPPTSLIGSFSDRHATRNDEEACGRFFGTCWYWWLPTVPLMGAIGYIGFRSRTWLHQH